jgi:predicted AAA+ superfamily ATPase
MVIYATSNRRHLIRERFSDRKGLLSDNPYEEVHATDTLQEKLSLADRFGITITFESPAQEEYLKIVEGLVQKEGLAISTEEVRREAVRWEMHYNGRSPRTAQQFVSFLKARQGLLSQD